MKYYVFKLIAPRESFVRDMTSEERLLMQAHSRYLSAHLAEGRVVVFGPVADPAGVYGGMDFRSCDRYRHAVE